MSEATMQTESPRAVIEELLRMSGMVEDQSLSVVLFRKLARDMRKAQVLVSDSEARFLVDYYYTVQESRKRGASQVRQMEKTTEPHEYLAWLTTHDAQLEEAIKLFLGAYVAAHPMGAWFENVKGIGPVLAAGLLASIKMDKETCPTVGHIWQFAGIAGSGQKEWAKGTKRPFSASLKKLCYLIGVSFMRFSNDPECVYGQLYRQRKAYEVAGNDDGRYREQAEREASKKGKDTDAWPWNNACYAAGSTKNYYALPNATIVRLAEERSENPAPKPRQSETPAEFTTRLRIWWLKAIREGPGSGLPMLHPGHIDDRARRYAVKQFLSDMHASWYRLAFGEEPPLPYPIAILGHAHHRKN